MAESEPLSAEDVAHVAKLALLDISDDEVATFTEQLRGVIETAQQMNEVDLEGVEPTHHPLGLSNVMRPDVAAPSLDRDEVLAQAPATEEGRFKVPPALGEAQ